MRAVLVTIADAANRQGEHAHPGLDAMIDGSLYSKRQVLRIVDDLVAEGWVSITERARRGHATVFDVDMTRRRLGDMTSPNPDVDGVTSRRGLGDTSDAIGCHDEPDGVTSPRTDERRTGTSTVNNNGTPTSSAVADADIGAIVDHCCTVLANAIERHRGGEGRPTITARWRKDMSLLLRRGPLHVDDAQPLTVEKVCATIAVVFGELAVPDRRTKFCWADQVRSPAALRDHWQQMRDAHRRQAQPTQSKGAATIDRVAARLIAERDGHPVLGLVQGGEG